MNSVKIAEAANFCSQLEAAVFILEGSSKEMPSYSRELLPVQLLVTLLHGESPVQARDSFRCCQE